MDNIIIHVMAQLNINPLAKSPGKTKIRIYNANNCNIQYVQHCRKINSMTTKLFTKESTEKNPSIVIGYQFQTINNDDIVNIKNKTVSFN